MQINRILLLGFILLFVVGCSTPKENLVGPPLPESPLSQSVPVLKDVSNYYVEEIENGIEDLEAVESLYFYLWSNLTPKDYRYIGTSTAVESSPERTEYYSVEICAADKACVDSLLQDYDGPWAPIVFHKTTFSLLDHTYAKIEMERFLDAHPEIEVKDIVEGGWNDGWWLYVVEPYDDLQAFVDNYPIPGIYGISKFVPEEDLNPD